MVAPPERLFCFKDYIFLVFNFIRERHLKISLNGPIISLQECKYCEK